MSQYPSKIPPVEFGLQFEKKFDSGFIIIVSLVDSQNQQIKFNIHNWELFEKKGKEYQKVVFIYYGYMKYFICPELLINNITDFEYEYLHIGEIGIPCNPNSKLYELCKQSILHNQPFYYNIDNDDNANLIIDSDSDSD